MGAKENYTAKMKAFCKENFGTEDLGECRYLMHTEYRDVWPEPKAPAKR